MAFEWSKKKNQANIRKHGVSFELANDIRWAGSDES